MLTIFICPAQNYSNYTKLKQFLKYSFWLHCKTKFVFKICRFLFVLEVEEKMQHCSMHSLNFSFLVVSLHSKLLSIFTCLAQNYSVYTKLKQCKKLCSFWLNCKTKLVFNIYTFLFVFKVEEKMQHCSMLPKESASLFKKNPEEFWRYL